MNRYAEQIFTPAGWLVCYLDGLYGFLCIASPRYDLRAPECIVQPVHSFSVLLFTFYRRTWKVPREHLSVRLGFAYLHLLPSRFSVFGQSPCASHYYFCLWDELLARPIDPIHNSKYHLIIYSILSFQCTSNTEWLCHCESDRESKNGELEISISSVEYNSMKCPFTSVLQYQSLFSGYTTEYMIRMHISNIRYYNHLRYIQDFWIIVTRKLLNQNNISPA